jgi:hypothetical protein
VPLLTALEERAGSAPVRTAEPFQYVVVSIEHDRKCIIPIHTSVSLLDDTLILKA